MPDYLILQRRPLSARLVFFTARRLEEEGEGEGAEEEQQLSDTAPTTELIVKEAAYEGEGGVEHVRRDVRAGDVVRVVEAAPGAGEQDAANAAAVVVARLATLRRWRETGGKDGRTFNWTPPAAAAAARPPPSAEPAPSPQQQPCKYFLNTGRCAKGLGCPYLHAATAEQRRAWVGERAAARRRRVGGAAADEHEEGGDDNEGGGAAAKAQRARIFAAWIGAAFFGGGGSHGGSTTPDSVVDVAGGRGALTFELAALTKNGDGDDDDDDDATGAEPLLLGRERVTLVDPRPLCLNRRQALRLRLQQQQQQQSSNAGNKSNKKPRWRVEDVLTGEVVSESRGMGSPVDDQPPSTIVFRQARACFGPDLWRSGAWQRAVEGDDENKKRPVVAALHPDQATDAALDYALERGLPFAIVPCCVFPALFPERRFGGGGGGGGGNGDGGKQQVRSYEDLVAYLVERSGGEVAVLPFVGRNVVVYGVGGGGQGGGAAPLPAEAVMRADRAAAREAARPPEFARPPSAPTTVPGAGEDDEDDDDEEEEDEEHDDDDDEAGEEQQEEGGLFEGGALLKAGRRR